MRKSILAMFVVMIAIFAVACGGNTAKGNGGDANAANGAGGGGGCAPAKADPEAQWKAQYKKGAEWVVHMNYGTDMWQKTEVIEVNFPKAKIKTSTKMTKDGNFENPTESEAEYKKPEGDGKMPEGTKMLGEGDEKVGDWDCHWTETETGGKKSKVWMVKKYASVIAKMEADGKVTMDLVSFKEGQ